MNELFIRKKNMEKVNLSIPQDWSEISVGTFMEFELLEKKDMSNLDLMVNIVSIFCDKDSSDVEKLSIQQLGNIMTDLEWVTAKPLKNFYQSWEHNGIKYGFIPNLSAIKVGEWIDLEQYMKAPVQNLHKLLSILYRPITKINNGVNNYEIEDYDSNTAKSRAELFYNWMPIDLGYGVALFFLSFVEELLVNIRESSTKEMKQIMEEMITKD